MTDSRHVIRPRRHEDGRSTPATRQDTAPRPPPSPFAAPHMRLEDQGRLARTRTPSVSSLVDPGQKPPHSRCVGPVLGPEYFRQKALLDAGAQVTADDDAYRPSD